MPPETLSPDHIVPESIGDSPVVSFDTAEWPQELHGPLVWTGVDFVNDEDYIFSFSEEDKAEIHAALAHFKGKLT